MSDKVIEFVLDNRNELVSFEERIPKNYKTEFLKSVEYIERTEEYFDNDSFRVRVHNHYLELHAFLCGRCGNYILSGKWFDNVEPSKHFCNCNTIISKGIIKTVMKSVIIN